MNLYPFNIKLCHKQKIKCLVQDLNGAYYPPNAEFPFQLKLLAAVIVGIIAPAHIHFSLIIFNMSLILAL